MSLHKRETSFYTSLLSLVLIMSLNGCGGNSSGPKEPNQQPIANAGPDQSTMNGYAIQLDGSLSRDYQGSSGNLTYEWTQVSGSTANFIDEEGQTQVSPWLVVPSADTDETLVFQLSVSDGVEQNTDLVEIDVTQCAASEGVIFEDCLGKGYGPLSVWEDKEEGEDKPLYDGQGDQHLQWELVDTGTSHGNVIQIIFNANDVFDEVNDNSNFHIGAPSVFSRDTQQNRGLDISDYAGGSISFDLRMLQPANFTHLMQFGLECFWPCTSDNAFVEDPEFMGEWQRYSYSLDYLAESGADLSNLSSVFRFSLPWNLQQGQLIVQVDNIVLSQSPVEPVAEPLLPADSALLELATENTVDLQPLIFFGNSGPAADFTPISNGHFQLDIHETFFWAPFFNIRPETLVESLEQFFHGTIKFELFVLDYGGNELGDFVVSADCINSCGVVPGYNIGRPTEGVWETVEIPVKELVKRGLDLSDVTQVFTLDYTAAEEGLSQVFVNDISIQIRNIVWEYQAP